MAQVGHGDGRRKKSKTGEDGSYRTAHVSLIKGVVDVGAVLSLEPILKSWQLCLSFKLDVLTTFSHSSLYVPNNLYLIILI